MIIHSTRLKLTALLLTSPFLLFLFVPLVHADDEDTGASRDRIKWPSPDFPTLQDAVDAAADDATIKIREGTFRIDSTVRIRGKRLKFVGAGNGTRRDRVTRLVGPEPRPVTDAAGNIVLAADEAIGLFQVESDSDVEFSKMHISGFDAGIIIRHDQRIGRAPNVHVNKLLISHTGRGILSVSASQLSVANTIIEFTLWNGISLSNPPTVHLQAFNVRSSSIGSPNGAGIYCENTHVYISKITIANASGGGVVAINCSLAILDSYILNSHLAGILLFESGAYITDNFIVNTGATFSGVLGDGISLWSSSTAFIEDNVVNGSERAGLSNLGSNASIGDSSFICSSFDMSAEPWNGQPAVFDDRGGVECGCGSEPLGPCAAKSYQLEPPPPVGGLE